MKQNIFIAILLVALLAAASKSYAQETINELQTRTSLDLSFKPFKKVKFTLSPELRFDENFSLDKYLIEGEVEYKIWKPFSVAARYGFVANLRNKKNTEYLGRYAFSAQIEKEFKHFEPSLQIMYSNYADDDVDDKNFLRYKAGIKYDIPNCKITPFAAAQLFQDLNSGERYKARYAVGADYKINKKNYLGMSYKFDYYYTEYLNKHIISLNYKIKF